MATEEDLSLDLKTVIKNIITEDYMINYWDPDEKE